MPRSLTVALSIATAGLLSLGAASRGFELFLTEATGAVLSEEFDQAGGIEDTIFAPGQDAGTPGGASLTSGPNKQLLLSSDGSGGDIALYANALTGSEDGTWLLSFEFTLLQSGVAFLCCPDQTGQHGFTRIMGVNSAGRVSLAGQLTNVTLSAGTKVHVVAALQRSGSTLQMTAFLMEPSSWTELASKSGTFDVPSTWLRELGLVQSRAGTGSAKVDSFNLTLL